MALHTINGFITYEQSRYTKTVGIGFSRYKPSAEYAADVVVIRPHSFEVEVPDNFDPRPQQIDTLKAQQQKATAAYHAMVTDIQRQIAELQALELVVPA